MPFELPEFSKKIQELNKGSEIERIKIAEKLVSFSSERGNPIYFEDFGLSEDSELIEGREIRREVLEGLSDLEKEEVIKSIETLKSFLMGPIFTDKFCEHSDVRNKWEEENEPEIEKLLGEKVFNYFKSNRLRINSCQDAMRGLEFLSEDIKDVKLKNSINLLRNKIPQEFYERIGELIKEENRREKYNLSSSPLEMFIEDAVVYHTLTNEGKLKAVFELSEIVKESLIILTETKQNPPED